MIKKIWNKLIGRERLIITPKGDCLIKYIEDKLLGKDVCVEEYDNIIWALKSDFGYLDNKHKITEEEMLTAILNELYKLKGGKYV